MCVFDPAEEQAQHLAKAIFSEICRQFDAHGPAKPMICEGGMRDVLIEGHIDLIKIASALSVRCCVQVPDVETVAEDV